MTAIATILALLPMALGLGEGAFLSTPLAVVVIGGLFTSTILTLILVPVLYLALDRLRPEAGGRRRWSLRPTRAATPAGGRRPDAGGRRVALGRAADERSDRAEDPSEEATVPSRPPRRPPQGRRRTPAEPPRRSTRRSSSTCSTRTSPRSTRRSSSTCSTRPSSPGPSTTPSRPSSRCTRTRSTSTPSRCRTRSTSSAGCRPWTWPTIHVSPDSKTMLEQDLEGELDAIARYKERIAQAEMLQEYGLRRALEDILIIEEEHARDLQSALSQ